MEEFPLCRRFGLDEAARRRRLAYLGLGADDCRCLVGLRPFFERIADSLVEDFYDHLLSFEETRRFFSDGDLMVRLRNAQHAHFIELASGDYDGAYFESRLRVGIAHARIGLEPEWYIGGYMRQASFLQARLFEELASSGEKLAAALSAVAKVVLLDIGLANDAYIHGGFVERSLADAHAREAERAHRALTERDQEAERREQLLQMVMHDVRSPVTAMMATARVGLRRWRATDEPPGRQFALIEETGAGVLRIIDDMVSIARTPHGELPVNPETFDVSQCVEVCVESLRSFAEQNAHFLTANCEEKVVADCLDPVLVRRVVSNLLVNAVRHTPAGTSVHVRCRALEERVEIRVADDGQGIPRRQREGLFEPRRAAPRRREGNEGAWVDTGLGLPFCALACRSMEGSILLAEADADRGTCFIVELPLGRG